MNVNVGSALRVPGRNPVDGLPPARHTGTIAKLARLGPAENGKLMKQIVELFMFCSMIDRNTPRISSPEYIEDLDKCLKM